MTQISVIFVSMMIVLCSSTMVRKLTQESWDETEKKIFLSNITKIVPIIEGYVDEILEDDAKEIQYDEFSEGFKEGSFAELIGETVTPEFIQRYWNLFANNKNFMTRGQFFFFVALYESEAALITLGKHPKFPKEKYEGTYDNPEFEKAVDGVFFTADDEAQWSIKKILNTKTIDPEATVSTDVVAKFLREQWEQELVNENVRKIKITELFDFVNNKLTVFSDWKGDKKMKLKTLKMFLYQFFFRVGHAIYQVKNPSKYKKNKNNDQKPNGASQNQGPQPQAPQNQGPQRPQPQSPQNQGPQRPQPQAPQNQGSKAPAPKSA